jgi:hypothetical protein
MVHPKKQLSVGPTECSLLIKLSEVRLSMEGNTFTQGASFCLTHRFPLHVRGSVYVMARVIN